VYILFCTVLFVSISQVIGCEDRLWNGLYCVGWGVLQHIQQPTMSILPSRSLTGSTNNNS